MASPTHPPGAPYSTLRPWRSRNFYIILGVLAVLTIACMAYFDTAFERAAAAVEANPTIVWLSWFATKFGGDGAPFLAILLIVAARSKWKQAGLTVFCAFIIQQGSTELIKFLVGRMRPHQAEGLTVFGGPASGYHSFPSGHTSYCFMLAIIAAAYFPRGRWWFYGAAAFVGMGRVMADVHFLSDILVGAVIGLLSGLLFLRAWPPDGDIFRPRPDDA